MDNLTVPVVLLYVGPYDMVTEEGEHLSGISCSYYLATDLSPREKDKKTGSIGMRPAKCSLDLSLLDKVQICPAVYNAEMMFKVGSDGRPVMAIADLDYAGDIELNIKG